jgi:hypothetical protein
MATESTPMDAMTPAAAEGTTMETEASPTP